VHDVRDEQVHLAAREGLSPTVMPGDAARFDEVADVA